MELLLSGQAIEHGKVDLLCLSETGLQIFLCAVGHIFNQSVAQAVNPGKVIEPVTAWITAADDNFAVVIRVRGAVVTEHDVSLGEAGNFNLAGLV